MPLHLAVANCGRNCIDSMRSFRAVRFLLSSSSHRAGGPIVWHTRCASPVLFGWCAFSRVCRSKTIGGNAAVSTHGAIPCGAVV